MLNEPGSDALVGGPLAGIGMTRQALQSQLRQKTLRTNDLEIMLRSLEQGSVRMTYTIEPSMGPQFDISGKAWRTGALEPKTESKISRGEVARHPET